MQKNNNNSTKYDDSIDLSYIFIQLIAAKKFIIIIVLIFSSLGLIKDFSPQLFVSSALLEIGEKNFRDNDGNIQLIETPTNVLKELNVFFIYRTNNISGVDELSFKKIDGSLISVEALSSSKDKSLAAIKQITSHILNRHKEMSINNIKQKLDPIRKNLSNLNLKAEHEAKKIKLSNEINKNNLIKEVNFLKNELQNLSKKIAENSSRLVAEYEAKKLNLNEKISSTLEALGLIDKKIISLDQIIQEESANLVLIQAKPDSFFERIMISPTLNQVIYDYKNQRLNNLEMKLDLETELKKHRSLLSDVEESLKNDEVEFVVFSSNSENVEFSTTQNIISKYFDILLDLKLKKTDLSFELQTKEDSLKNQSINFSDNSDVMFGYEQEKFDLEKQLDFLTNLSPNQTSLVSKISSIKEPMQRGKYFIVSVFLGLVFSIFLVITYNWLKNFNIKND